MAYSKQNWADGQVITADKLNAMDDGIAETSNQYVSTRISEGDTIGNVPGQPLKVTLSGEGAKPTKLFVASDNILQMPTSGSGDKNGLHYEFTPNGLNISGMPTSSGFDIVDLVGNLNGVILPRSKYFIVQNMNTSEFNVNTVIFDDAYVASVNSVNAVLIKNDGSSGISRIAVKCNEVKEINITGLKVAIVPYHQYSDFHDGTNVVVDTGVENPFGHEDSKTVTVPSIGRQDIVRLFTDSTVIPSYSTEYRDDSVSIVKLLELGNPLWGKHYHACGDSFTYGAGLGEVDPVTGERLTANYLVAKYNNMKFTKDAVSGSDMTNVDDASNPFSVNRYQNIPEDTDYITLQFGLNEVDLADAPETLGTNADTGTNTMWGAYNTVLEWILTNRPKAKVGIIISDSWMTEAYANALIEIAEFWGVPYLDLGGDPQVSMNIGGRRNGSGITVGEKAKTLRNNQFQNSDSDTHPNAEGNRWRYTALQEFLRRL